MSDKDLIEEYLKGDQKAIETLMEKHLQGIYNVCYNVSQDKKDSEDITQEVLLKVLKNIKSFKFQSEFKTWVYRIAYNEAINFVKKPKPMYNFDEKLDLEHSNPDSSEKVNKEYISKILMQELDKLNETDRNLIVMFYYENLRINEIVEITGLTESNVKVRLHRTRETLKANLQQYGKIFEDLL